MTAQSVVRLATLEDEPQIMVLCKLLHEENGLFPMDDDLVNETIKLGTERRKGLIGVIGTQDHLEGIIFLQVSNFWYSTQPYLVELFNFVHPQHRRSNHAKALIEFAKKCTTDDLKLVIGIISNERTAAKVRLYERQLGTPAGAFFVYPN